MRTRILVLASLALCMWGCADDDEMTWPTGDNGPSFAGSCNFPNAARCDEYADPQATTDLSGTCASSGGEWTTGQCPVLMRLGVCTSTAPATRSFVYSMDAVTMLKAACAAPGRFIAIKPPTPTGGSGGSGGSTSGGMGGGAGTTGGMGGAVDEDAGM